MRSCLLDTNLVLRFLLGEPEDQATAAGRVFARAERGELELVLLPAVTAEVVYVLQSFYKTDPGDISDALEAVLHLPGVACDEANVLQDALRRYRETRVSFIDAYLAAVAKARAAAVASFDADFRKFDDIQLLHPMQQES